MSKCMSCGRPLVDGECLSCSGELSEATDVTPALDPGLLETEVTAPNSPPSLVKAAGVRRPSSADVPRSPTPPSVAAAARRASWYEVAAQVVTDPNLVVSKPPPPVFSVSGAHMLPDEEARHLAVEGTQLPLILMVAMLLRHGSLLIMGKADGSPVGLGLLGVAAFCQLTQKPILKPVVILALVFEAAHSLYLANLATGGWVMMVPSVGGALAALCAIALLLMHDETVNRVMLIIGIGAVGASVILSQYYGDQRDSDPLPNRTYADSSGLIWRVPEGYTLFDGRQPGASYHGPTTGLRAFFVSNDRQVWGGLIALQLPPNGPLNAVLPAIDPPPVAPVAADDLLPESIRVERATVLRFPFNGTNLVFAEKAPDGRTLAIFVRGTGLSPVTERNLLESLITGLSVPAGHKARAPSVGMTPLVAPIPDAGSRPAPSLTAEVTATPTARADAGAAPSLPNSETRLGAISP